jgi:hypothetical protein
MITAHVTLLMMLKPQQWPALCLQDAAGDAQRNVQKGADKAGSKAEQAGDSLKVRMVLLGVGV